jgi:hypothetical protein
MTRNNVCTTIGLRYLKSPEEPVGIQRGQRLPLDLHRSYSNCLVAHGVSATALRERKPAVFMMGAPTEDHYGLTCQ